MYAEHIIGLRATELARPDSPKTAVAVRRRFDAIEASGVLLPRPEPKAPGEDGSLFGLDRLAGDGRYVFLSYGARYREVREEALCYGFLFDPMALILQHGALVGPDMMEEYDTILDEVVREVDASLPPLPQASDAEIAEFMALMGEEDPGMAAYIQQASTSRYHDLCDAVISGDTAVEGAELAIRMFRERAQVAQAELRLSGADALNALTLGMEILVPDYLPLALCIGRIEAGRIYSDTSAVSEPSILPVED
jgi:hypothetical protein